jgi:hypothetical protein
MLSQTAAAAGALTDHNHTTAASDGGQLTNAGVDGYLDWTELATPGTPAANHIYMYAVDDQGKHFVEFKDEDGVVSRIQRDVAVFMAKNTTGGALTAGTAVYVNGIIGAFPTIAAAKADATATLPCAGLLLTSAANNAFVKVLGMGRVTGSAAHPFDTSGFTAGNLLYLSATTAGLLTATAPTYPNLVQYVGICTVSHAITGSVLKIAGAVYIAHEAAHIAHDTLWDLLGDIVYASADNTAARLAGNITIKKKFLSQTGNATVSAAPAWAILGRQLKIVATGLTVNTDTKGWTEWLGPDSVTVRAVLNYAGASGTAETWLVYRSAWSTDNAYALATLVATLLTVVGTSGMHLESVTDIALAPKDRLSIQHTIGSTNGTGVEMTFVEQA